MPRKIVTDGSKKVVLISLISDIAITVAKLAAALYTGSASMMAEAVHSFLDGSNEVLLIYGRRVAQEKTQLYPLGRDMELFFWSFIVSLLLFVLGGMFNIVHGIYRLLVPEPLGHPMVGLAVLVFSAVFDTYALHISFRAIGQRNPYGSLWQWVKHTSSADLLVVSLTNIASMIGLLIAIAALICTWATGEPRWDGAGSLAIGLLLIVTSLVLARELKSLLIGEATKFDYEQPIKELLKEIDSSARILQLLSLRRGFNKVLLAYKLHPGGIIYTMDAIEMSNKLEDKVRERFKEVSWQFVELDVREHRD